MKSGSEGPGLYRPKRSVNNAVMLARRSCRRGYGSALGVKSLLQSVICLPLVEHFLDEHSKPRLYQSQVWNSTELLPASQLFSTRRFRECPKTIHNTTGRRRFLIGRYHGRLASIVTGLAWYRRGAIGIRIVHSLTLWRAPEFCASALWLINATEILLTG